MWWAWNNVETVNSSGKPKRKSENKYTRRALSPSPGISRAVIMGMNTRHWGYNVATQPEPRGLVEKSCRSCSLRSIHKERKKVVSVLAVTFLRPCLAFLMFRLRLCWRWRRRQPDQHREWELLAEKGWTIYNEIVCHRSSWSLIECLHVLWPSPSRDFLGFEHHWYRQDIVD